MVGTPLKKTDQNAKEKRIRRLTHWFFVREIIQQTNGNLTAAEVAERANFRFNLKLNARHVAWLAHYNGWSLWIRCSVNQVATIRDSAEIVDVAAMFESGRFDASLLASPE